MTAAKNTAENAANDRGNGTGESGSSLVRRLGLVLGPALFALILAAPELAGLEGAARGAAALTAWMAAWWVTEAVPLEATALLPIVVYPLTGVISAGQVTLHYGSPTRRRPPFSCP
ncbi:MAG TPA: hypothetical protein VIK93_03075 [Limnochordales bacterium]